MMMDTREVAAYLRLKQRRIYDLVRANALPHVRATGKLLFPRAEVDAWLASKSAPPKKAGASPAIIAGSHDPLLEWAARESGSGLAVLACGSRAGLDKLAEGTASIAAMHWLDEAASTTCRWCARGCPAAEVVAIEWAQRRQGLVVAPGNPMKFAPSPILRRRKRASSCASLHPAASVCSSTSPHARASQGTLRVTGKPTLAETDLAAAIRNGKADAGIAIEAAAHAHGLASFRSRASASTSSFAAAITSRNPSRR